MAVRAMKKFLVVLIALFVAIPVTAGAVTIDFNTIPIAVAVGDQITTQYSAYGVVFLPGFEGAIPTIAQDGGWLGVNVLSTSDGLGLGAGDFTIQFPSYAMNVSFDSGLWDTNSGTVTVTDISGNTHVYLTLIPTEIIIVDDTPTEVLTTPFYHFAFNALSGGDDLTGVLIRDIYFDSSSDAGGASITNLQFTQVPEPGTLILLGSGLVGLATYSLKRRKK